MENAAIANKACTRAKHMKSVVKSLAIVLALLFTLAVGSENGQTRDKIEPLPRDLEIQLALSALPPHLRDNATVYVLNPNKGFEKLEVERIGVGKHEEFHKLYSPAARSEVTEAKKRLRDRPKLGCNGNTRADGPFEAPCKLP